MAGRLGVRSRIQDTGWWRPFILMMSLFPYLLVAAVCFEGGRSGREAPFGSLTSGVCFHSALVATGAIPCQSPRSSPP